MKLAKRTNVISLGIGFGLLWIFVAACGSAGDGALSIDALRKKDGGAKDKGEASVTAPRFCNDADGGQAADGHTNERWHACQPHGKSKDDVTARPDGAASDDRPGHHGNGNANGNRDASKETGPRFCDDADGGQAADGHTNERWHACAPHGNGFGAHGDAGNK
jgi:hypothetical protein